MQENKNQAENSEEVKLKGKGESFRGLVKTFLYALVLAFLIKQFVFNTTLVIGHSMVPTLDEKDRLICLVYPLYFTQPKKGDIVVLDAPDNSGDEYIKRVIALEGDSVQISDGNVFVNGVKLEEDYIVKGIETQSLGESTWQVEEGKVFVLGDNRNPGKSSDSRVFGTVDATSIRSIAVFRYFPLNSKFGILK